MQTTLRPTIAESDQGDAIDYLDDPFIDRIWQDLSGQVTYEMIRQVVAEEATSFRNARITRFVPILIRRNIREKLVTLVRGRANGPHSSQIICPQEGALAGPQSP